MKIYPDRILNRIMQKGYTINAFASEFGFTQQSLSAWLKGEYNPKPASVRRLANALKCEITDIAEYTGNLEQVFDEIDSEREIYKERFWGVDIFDNVNAINMALRNRDSLDKSSPNYDEDFNNENKTITDELMNMFQKMAMALKVDALPVDYNKLLADTMIQYERRILDAVMASSMNPEAKITVYNTIKDIE